MIYYIISNIKIFEFGTMIKKYISIDDIKNYIGLNELYLSFCNMIEYL